MLSYVLEISIAGEAKMLHSGPGALVPSLLLAACAWSSTAQAATAVDLELVLAVDVSGSVSRDEQALERTGLVAAFQDRQVIEAILALPRGLAVAVVAFAGAGQTRTIVGWQLLSDTASVQAFAQQVAESLPFAFERCGLTAVGDALRWSQQALVDNAYVGAARIDVAGDGSSSEGEDTATSRDRAVAAGITVSGLAIQNEEFRLEEYYRRNVIGGPGAFVLTAVDYESFALAMRLKLLRELAPGPTAERGPI
jgi:hypothetical protein